MGTADALPLEALDPALEAEAREVEQALVPSLASQEDVERLRLHPALARLPVELDVAAPVGNFRVRDLLSLEAGVVISTHWGHGEDMPLQAGKVQLAWTEFEVVDRQLAVRVTRLA
jgi:flagellar motor switch protein FliM